jgi:hypothetical protein
MLPCQETPSGIREPDQDPPPPHATKLSAPIIVEILQRDHESSIAEIDMPLCLVKKIHTPTPRKTSSDTNCHHLLVMMRSN